MRPIRIVVGLLLAGALIAACAPPPPTAAPGAPTSPPKVEPTKPSAAAPTTAAPTAAPTPAAKIKRGGTLRIQRQNEWEGMDPVLAQEPAADVDLTLEGLVQYQQDPTTKKWDIAPQLAESWQFTDPKTLVLKLRKGIKFQDGSDWNADVAKWNLDRARTNPKTFAKEHTACHDSVDKVDDYTVKINLKAACVSVLANLIPERKNATMISKAYWEKVGDDGTVKKAVGTGPYIQDQWLTGDRVIYKRWDHYYLNGADGQPLPYPDQVIVRLIQDPSVALLELKAGTLDFAYQIQGKDVAGLKADPNLVVMERPWQGPIYVLNFNARPDARFTGDKNKKLRQATYFSFDRDAMAKVLGLGIGRPAYYLTSPGSLGYSDSTQPRYDYNPEKAKQLMGEWAKENNQTLPVPATLSIISRPEDVQNGQMYKQMMDAIGFNLTIDAQERVAWVKHTLAGEYEMGTQVSGQVFPDPDLDTGRRFLTGGGSNYSGWTDASMDKCLEEGRSTLDRDQRQKVYERCYSMANEAAYYGYSWQRTWVEALSKRVQGYVQAWSEFTWKYVWLSN